MQDFLNVRPRECAVSPGFVDPTVVPHVLFQAVQDDCEAHRRVLLEHKLR